MNATICQAIKEMKCLSFYYDGHKRVVEPHAHGISTAGNEVMRCYQIRGGSNSGNVPDWKMMTVNKISSLSISDESFSGPRNGYRKSDRGMSTIFCEL